MKAGSTGTLVAVGCLVLARLLGACGDDPASGNGAGPSGPDASADEGTSSDTGPGPACTDGQKSAGETDVDCGGSCAPCAVGKTCAGDGDCASGACETGICLQTSVCYASGFCWENPTPTADTLYGVSGSSANDVWIVGGPGSVFHWNGARLAPRAPAIDTFLTSVHALDATHVWAVGGEGTIVFWDGTKWTTQPSGSNQQLNAVWAIDADDVWAVGNRGTVLHYSGGSWSTIASSAYPPHLWGVYAANKTDVFIAGDTGRLAKWDGGQFVAETIAGGGTPSFRAIWGAGGSAWAGTDDAVYTRTGSGWTLEASVAGGVRSGFALDATTSIAAGYGAVHRRAGTSWTPETRPAAAFAVWGSSATDLWSVGTRAIDHLEGGTWKSFIREERAKVRGIAASDPSNVVAVGESGTVLRRNGGQWQKETTGDSGDLNAVWTLGATSTVAVGQNGRIWRWNGASWSKESVSGVFDGWTAVTGSGPTLQWIVSDAGKVARHDGVGWKLDDNGGNTSSLFGVYAVDPANAWAVGNGGVILRFDGATWTKEDSGTTAELRGVWGASASDVWAVGRNVLLRRTNGAWAVFDGAFGDHNVAIAGSGANDIWVANSNGSSLHHWNGATWETFSQPAASVIGLAMTGKTTWAVGSEGELLVRP